MDKATDRAIIEGADRTGTDTGTDATAGGAAGKVVVAPPAGDAEACSREEAEVMDLLAEHVPLSLLMDLALPSGPTSQELLQAEGLPEEQWWDGGSATRRGA